MRKIPPTELLFTIALGGRRHLAGRGVRAAAVAARTGTAQAAREHVSVGALLRDRSLAMVLIASVVTVTAFELLVVYLPLLGTERHIDTRDIGTSAGGALASCRSCRACSMRGC